MINAPRVELTEIKTMVLSRLCRCPRAGDRGPWYSVTATTDAVTNINGIRLGDFVNGGDVIATQDSAQLELQLKKVQAKLRETELKLAGSQAELQTEEELLAVSEAQLRLLAGKAKRAEVSLQIMRLRLDAALKWHLTRA